MLLFSMSSVMMVATCCALLTLLVTWPILQIFWHPSRLWVALALASLVASFTEDLAAALIAASAAFFCWRSAAA